MKRSVASFFEIRLDITIEEASGFHVSEIYWAIVTPYKFNWFFDIIVKLASWSANCFYYIFIIGRLFLYLFWKVKSFLKSDFVLKLVSFEFTGKLFPFVVVLRFFLFHLVFEISSIDFDFVQKLRSLMPVITKTLSTHEWRTDNILDWCSCDVSVIVSRPVTNHWNGLRPCDLFCFDIRRKSRFLIFIQAIQNPPDFLINLINVINPILLNCLIGLIQPFGIITRP